MRNEPEASMATLSTPSPAVNGLHDGLAAVADLPTHLNVIPPQRIHLRPLPGTADEDDVVPAKRCERVDGTLVEKAVASTNPVAAGQASLSVRPNSATSRPTRKFERAGWRAELDPLHPTDRTP
jgi:hypothetical protein